MYVAPTYTAPVYGYCYCEYPRRGCGGFAIIVVLFILLIIVGASCCHHKC
ncbi:YjcZ family sporulation protein [Bacillus sp. FJAT-53711]|uniref:YjcZ family sporulation protein n=1 Tax=Bacillus yunxiaonensis TaxID=3127665 RepID=A0ABU8FRG3_9BACI